MAATLRVGGKTSMRRREKGVAIGRGWGLTEE